MTVSLKQKAHSRIDSHQHFWLRERGDYDWLTPELSDIYRDFKPEDLRPLLVNSKISKTVLVQAAETDSETDFLLGIAKQTDFDVGVVGWVDMTSDNTISRLDELSSNSYFKGVRPMLQDMTDDRWILKPELDRVFRYLVDENLCFDALVKPRHLDALYELLLTYPDLKVVIDHGAKPEIANGGYQEWADKLSIIANNTNAFCKFSGLMTEAKSGTNILDINRYADFLLDNFTADRLMWGSDWPVVNLASNLNSWVVWCENYFSLLEFEAQQSIWHRSAEVFYDL